MDSEQILQQGLTEAGAVLVVQAQVKSEEELRTLRDYVVESLTLGVLTLGPDMSYQLERFPALSGVKVNQQPQVPVILRSHDIPQPSPSGKRKGRASAAEEKTNILSRLKAYREIHGLGCYGELAKHCQGLTEEMIRGLALGEVTLPIEDWRKVGNALEKLEGGRDGNGG